MVMVRLETAGAQRAHQEAATSRYTSMVRRATSSQVYGSILARAAAPSFSRSPASSRSRPRWAAIASMSQGRSVRRPSFPDSISSAAPAAAAGDHGKAGRHRFGDHQSERVVNARKDQRVGGREERLDPPGVRVKDHAIGDLLLLGDRAERAGVRPGQDQEGDSPRRRGRADRGGRALLHVADVQGEEAVVRDPDRGPNRCTKAIPIVRMKGRRVRPVVHHFHAGRPPVQLRQVGLHPFGDRDDPARGRPAQGLPLQPGHQALKHPLPPGQLDALACQGVEPGRLAKVGGGQVVPQTAQPLRVNDVEPAADLERRRQDERQHRGQGVPAPRRDVVERDPGGVRVVHGVGEDMDVVIASEPAGQFGDVATVPAVPVVVMDDERDLEAARRGRRAAGRRRERLRRSSREARLLRRPGRLVGCRSAWIVCSSAKSDWYKAAARRPNRIRSSASARSASAASMNSDGRPTGASETAPASPHRGSVRAPSVVTIGLPIARPAMRLVLRLLTPSG